jgi:hypothetical protein
MVFSPLIFLASCCDEEPAELNVYVGHLSERECKNSRVPLATMPTTLYSHVKESNPLLGGTVSSIEPGIGSVSSPGISHQTVTSDTEFVAKPPSGSCASSDSITVNVVTEDTPSTWEGKWNTACSKIEFEINKEFISEKIKAKDITALWAPIVDTDGDGAGDFVCSTPPFLDGFHVEEVLDFQFTTT